MYKRNDTRYIVQRFVTFALSVLLFCVTDGQAENNTYGSPKAPVEATQSRKTVKSIEPSTLKPSQLQIKADKEATQSLADTTPEAPSLPAITEPGNPTGSIDKNAAVSRPTNDTQHPSPKSSAKSEALEQTSPAFDKKGDIHLNNLRKPEGSKNIDLLSNTRPISRIDSAFPRSDAVFEAPAKPKDATPVLDQMPVTVSEEHLVIVGQGDVTETEIHQHLTDTGMEITGKFTLESINTSVYTVVASSQVTKGDGGRLIEEELFHVQPNYIYRTLADPLDHLQQIRKDIDFDRIHQQLTGKNITIGIIDTGVDQNHPDLVGAITNQKNFLTQKQLSPEIHGTAVAGLIGSRQNGSGISGIAPHALIRSLRACRQEGSGSATGECYSSSVSRSLDYAILNDIDIINLSIGSASVDPLLVRLIEAAAAKNIVIVAATGNNPEQRKVHFPASHPLVVSVAGCDRSGNLLPNSRVAAQATLVLPSVHLFTTIPGGRYNFLSGTSFASAVATGILALYLEQEGRQVDLILPPRNNTLCEWIGNLLHITACP